MRDYYLLYATRGEFCRRLGNRTDAAEAYMRALELVESEPVRRFILKRLRELREPPMHAD